MTTPRNGQETARSTNTWFLRLALLSLAAVAFLGLAACGGSEPKPAPAPPPPPPSAPAPPPPPPPSPPPGTDFSIYVQRDNSMVGISIECYSFYSDGTVELRHGGTAQVNDTGSYSGDEESGEISWNSGRYTSYSWDGAAYDVNGAGGVSIASCLS